ncbi:MAG: putative histone-arginine methyltransferase CARM1 [Monoraphidium minutum]|nr:MAG: putative histone-arginine methyltransferase CARM1 [Monoraphidium minutum]
MQSYSVRASAPLGAALGAADDCSECSASVCSSGGAGAHPTLHVARTGAGGAEGIAIPLEPDTVWRAGPELLLVRAGAAALQRWRDAQQQQARRDAPAEASHAGGPQLLALQCGSEQAAADLAEECEAAVRRAAASAAGPSGKGAAAGGGDGGGGRRGNAFDAKTDRASSDMYFHYYGMLQHQQNMLQDATRTGTYHAAILGNRPDFEGKVVMDVGAGSGILSLFAAQAGAAKVYAVEASGMAKFAARLAAANPPFGRAVEVLHSKVEELSLPAGEKVDVLVSEPMGTLLVNERMLETYIFARDRFLKPGGRMFPQIGRIHAAAFTDALLYGEVAQKAAFWQQPSFCGVDVTCLFEPAAESYFAQVVVDAFDPSILVSGCATRVFDFATATEADLADIEIPLSLTVAAPPPVTVHGLATWFDVLFNGSATQRWLSTAPGLPTTHWFQLRCVLAQPIVVMQPSALLTGTLRLAAHERQSYSVELELTGPPLQPGGPPQRSTGRYDLKEPYYRQLTNWYAYQQQAAAAAPPQAQAQAQAPPSAAHGQQHGQQAPGHGAQQQPQQQQVYGYGGGQQQQQWQHFG